MSVVIFFFFSFNSFRSIVFFTKSLFVNMWAHCIVRPGTIYLWVDASLIIIYACNWVYTGTWLDMLLQELAELKKSKVFKRAKFNCRPKKKKEIFFFAYNIAKDKYILYIFLLLLQ